MKILKFITLILLLALGACKKDDNKVEEPTPPNEEELITTVTLHFTEVGNTTNHFMASFIDLDGDGGDEPTIDSISLDANTTYEVSLELLNESVEPVEVITTEIQEENTEHIFCFESSESNLTVNITDTDGTHPVGLESEWITNDTSDGIIIIKLKHQPDSAKNGTCLPGETDVEVTFNFVIK